MFISFTSCDRELVDINDLNIPISTKYSIVIEGFISTEKTIYEVKLTKPLSDYETPYMPIENAQVKLIQGNNQYCYIATSKPGIYETKDSLAGIIGEIYTLEVKYNNTIYTATDSLVGCDAIIDYPGHKTFYKPDFYVINSQQHNFGYEQPSIWNFTEYSNQNLEMLSEDIKDLHNINLYNYIGSIPQGIFPNGTLGTSASGPANDSLEIIKMSVSNAYYGYLLSQFNITDWGTGIFSTIPGNTKTNVNNGGTGYFYCTDVKRYRMTYKDLAELTQ